MTSKGLKRNCTTFLARWAIDDTAKYVAEAVSDRELANTALAVAGDVLTAKQLKAGRYKRF